jgi:hypothetical protein
MLAILLLAAASSLLRAGGALPASTIEPSVEPSSQRFAAAPARQVFFLPVALAPKGQQPFALILCRFPDTAEEPAPALHFEALLHDGSDSLNAYWREVSYDRINLDGSRVVGWYVLPFPAAAYRNSGQDVDLFRLAADCAAAADAELYFPDYVGINLAFNRSFPGGPKGGQVCLDLDGAARCYGVTFLWSDVVTNRAALAHEMGHAFGLRHSAIGGAPGYANPWDLMGEGGWCWPDPGCSAAPQHLSAFQKDQLGFIPADRKYLAPASSRATVVLERMAEPGANGFLMAQIPIADSADHFYTIEARQRTGHDAALSVDAIVIHEVHAAEPTPAHLVSRPTNTNSYIAGSIWTTGRSFVDAEHGIEITVDGETESGFIVTISVQW